MTTALLLRRAILLLDLGYGVGELVQVCPKCIQEPQDGVPANAAPTSLDLGDIGRVNVEPDRQLVLRQAGAITQDLERSAEHDLILRRVTHLSTFSQVGLSSRDQN